VLGAARSSCSRSLCNVASSRSRVTLSISLIRCPLKHDTGGQELVSANYDSEPLLLKRGTLAAIWRSSVREVATADDVTRPALHTPGAGDRPGLQVDGTFAPGAPEITQLTMPVDRCGAAVHASPPGSGSISAGGTYPGR
jgi:hypothetical protein